MADQKSMFRVAFSADFLDEQRRPIFPDMGLSVLEAVPGIHYEFLPELRPEYVPEQLDGYDVLITLKPRVTAASLKGISRLTAIGRCGVGYDNIDLAACTEHDIALYITPAGVARSVAESIVIFVLALSHNMLLKDRYMRAGRWTESTRELGREPRQRVVGTIGVGNIASEAVRLLRVFDVARFLATDPYASPEKAAQMGVELVPLETLLRESDYVLVNCPLTPQTRGLMGKAQFALMKPDAVIINTARGPIIDESALIEALESKKIRGAGLDVFEHEPLQSDSPLLKMDNVILTSHSLCWTEEFFRDICRIDCEGAVAVHSGNPPGSVVNKDVLSRPGFLSKLEAYGKALAQKGGQR